MMRGDDVRLAQRTLQNNGYWVGTIDGVFGEITGRAAEQAKYDLGYRLRSVLPTYGQALHNFLTGRKKPSLLMRRRANARKSKQNLGKRAADIARSYVGVKENPPNTNRVLFSQWYGMVGPWCLMFVTYCFVKSGSTAFKRGSKWAYCPFMLNDARAGRGLTIVPANQATKGDIVLYSWRQNGVADHVGIVLTPVDKNGNFQNCEGNTSISSDDNGGSVMIRTRNTRSVIAFCRALS
jgi:hypothetical protein